jgi:hypothetical protein
MFSVKIKYCLRRGGQHEPVKGIMCIQNNAIFTSFFGSIWRSQSANSQSSVRYVTLRLVAFMRAAAAEVLYDIVARN